VFRVGCCQAVSALTMHTVPSAAIWAVVGPWLRPTAAAAPALKAAMKLRRTADRWRRNVVRRRRLGTDLSCQCHRFWKRCDVEISDANGLGPTASRRRLQAALRHLRLRAGLTQQQVAEALDWSVSKMIRMEGGESRVSVIDVRALAQLYEVSDVESVARIIELAQRGRRRAPEWWTKYGSVGGRDLLTYLGLEEEALTLYLYGASTIPGLLQTVRYAHEALAARYSDEGETIERLAALHKERQYRVFHSERLVQIIAVIDESALRRGAKSVVREQLASLARAAALSNVRIHILPFDAGISNPCGVGSFTIAENAEYDSLLGVALGEVHVDTALITRLDLMKEFMGSFRRLQIQSLTTNFSAAFIHRAVQDAIG
jgi:transcriptional regulator with XRE-family HTH domain